MADRRPTLVIATGATLVLAGLWQLVRGTGDAAGTGTSPVSTAVAFFLVLGGLCWGLWQVRNSSAADGGFEAAGPIVERAPERTPAAQPLSGRTLADALADACKRAREERSVEAGLDAVRPLLADTLAAALVQGGADRAAAERAVVDGTWTDDAVAAAILSPSVTGPPRPLRERITAWLYPERTLRRRVRRVVGELDAAASEALPTVPGQRAPRRVPTVHPRLESLRRQVDGTLQPAVGTVVDDARSTAPDGGARGPGQEGTD